MKKTLKWILIFIAVLLLLPLVSAAILAFLVPPKAIKDFATARISDSLGRTVSIESVSMNLFEGIKLKGIYIGNTKDFSGQPFLTADSFNLKYSFWPLLLGKVLIHEIELVSPKILIEKNRLGRTNLETENKSLPTGRHGPKSGDERQTQGKNIDLAVDNIRIKNGQITYHDQLIGKNEIKNIDLKISGIMLSLIKPIEVSAAARATYLKKDFPLSVNAKIKIDPSLNKVSVPALEIGIADEKFACPFEIKDFKSGPEISFDLSSSKLSIETLIGILAVGSELPAEKPAPGALTKSVKSSLAQIPDTLKIKGEIKLENTVFQKLKLDRLNASLSLSGKRVWLKLKDVAGYGGNLSLEGKIDLANLSYNINPLNIKTLNAGPFLNDFIDSFMPGLLNLKNKAEGKLDLFLKVEGRGIEMPDVFGNAKIEGVVVLTKGKLSNIKSIENIANSFDLPILRNAILVKGLRAEGLLSRKVLNVKNLDLRDTDIEVSFTGGLDFNSMKYQPGNRLTLKLSPFVSKDLPPQLTVLKDDRGFLALDFELQGPLSSPLPAPRLEKPIEKTIGKLKVKVEAKKFELEGQLKTKTGAETENLKKKAEDKIKRILKF